VPKAFGGISEQLDSRSLVICRETLARHDGLADFAFAMQGLGSGPITLAGNADVQKEWLPKVARGEAIAAFALSEPNAGSDVGAMVCTARDDGDSYVLDGEKTWISNGGIADVYCVFARTGEAPGTRGISAFVVPARTPGLTIAERIDVIAPHPLARLRFTACRVPKSHLLGEPGEGFKLAMRTLDIFRASVAAAALGFARRALDEALAFSAARPMFGQQLLDFQLTQATLGDMACDIDAAALLTYRAAWLRDTHAERTSAASSVAKLYASEVAVRAADACVQIHGGYGFVKDYPAEKFFRDVKLCTIGEGTSEIQRLVIARQLLAG
jgi:acyl-CoA dehydrogenase